MYIETTPHLPICIGKAESTAVGQILCCECRSSRPTSCLFRNIQLRSRNIFRAWGKEGSPGKMGKEGGKIDLPMPEKCYGFEAVCYENDSWYSTGTHSTQFARQRWIQPRLTALTLCIGKIKSDICTAKEDIRRHAPCWTSSSIWVFWAVIDIALRNLKHEGQIAHENSGMLERKFWISRKPDETHQTSYRMIHLLQFPSIAL